MKATRAPRPPRPDTGYAVFGQHGWCFVWTVSRLKRDAIKKAVEGMRDGWPEYRRQGWRCLRVTITPVEPTP